MRGKEGTVPKLVPYEIFLLRRLQQAQRLASGEARYPGEGAVVPFSRLVPPAARCGDDDFVATVADV